MKPNVVLAPAPRAPFQASFFTVTAEPETVSLPPHSCVTDWPEPSVKVEVQLGIAAVPALTVTSPWKPPGHSPTTL